MHANNNSLTGVILTALIPLLLVIALVLCLIILSRVAYRCYISRKKNTSLKFDDNQQGIYEEVCHSTIDFVDETLKMEENSAYEMNECHAQGESQIRHTVMGDCVCD